MPTSRGDLTAAQLRTLRVIYEQTRRDRYSTGQSIAMALWPDSRAWEKRTRRHADNHPGQMGGTMSMKGARAGWDLHRIGLVTTIPNSINQTRFVTTPAGDRIIEETSSDDRAR